MQVRIWLLVKDGHATCPTQVTLPSNSHGHILYNSREEQWIMGTGEAGGAIVSFISFFLSALKSTIGPVSVLGTIAAWDFPRIPKISSL